MSYIGHSIEFIIMKVTKQQSFKPTQQTDSAILHLMHICVGHWSSWWYPDFCSSDGGFPPQVYLDCKSVKCIYIETDDRVIMLNVFCIYDKHHVIERYLHK